MFTGIIDHEAHVTAIFKAGAGLCLKIESRFRDFSAGESIAVDGVCLTLVDFGEGTFDVQLSSETLDKSIAGGYSVGRRVNLERPLRVGDALGGHWVTGHVDGTARVASFLNQGEFREILFEASDPLVAHKGSVTVNGVSLTVNRVDSKCSRSKCSRSKGFRSKGFRSDGFTPHGFTVMLIPHTLEHTNLKDLKVGDLVNIEYDMLYKMVRDQLQNLKGNSV